MTNQPVDHHSVFASPLPVAPPPAWYDDPADPANFRYWDGARWTAHRSPKRAAQPVAAGAEGAAPIYQAPGAQAASAIVQPATSVSPGWPLPRLLAALGAIAIIIGSVTTWASVSGSYMSIDIKGTEGDGVITLVGGVVILGLLFVRKYGGGIIVGILTGGVLVTDLVNVGGIAGEVGVATVSVGWGLYLATVGAAIAVVALILLKLSERARVTAAQ